MLRFSLIHGPACRSEVYVDPAIGATMRHKQVGFSDFADYTEDHQKRKQKQLEICSMLWHKRKCNSRGGALQRGENNKGKTVPAPPALWNAKPIPLG